MSVRVIWTDYRCFSCDWHPQETNNILAYNEVLAHMQSHHRTADHGPSAVPQKGFSK